MPFNFCLDTGFLEELISDPATTDTNSDIKLEETENDMKNLSNCNEMYSCSICGRYCQDAKKLELHTLGMAFKGDIFSDDKSCLTILPL